MKFLYLIFLFNPLLSQSQIVDLTIKDLESKKSIPYAKIIYNHKPIQVADINGQVKLNSQLKIVEVSAIGYDTAEVILGVEKQYVYLSKRDKKIKEVLIKPKPDVFANQLIKEMLERFDANLPDKLASYQLGIYSKFVMDVIKDSVKSTDTSKTKKADTIDSEVNDFLNHSKLFVWEKASVQKFDMRYGDKKIVLTSKMSGFKQPIYELLAKSLDDINILPNLFKNDVYKDYNFNFSDSVLVNNRKTYEISFFPIKKYKTKRSRSGFVQIDSSTRALIRYQGTRKEGFTELTNQIVEEKCFTKTVFYRLTNAMFQINGGSSLTTFKMKVEDIVTPKSFSKSEFQGNVNEISASLNDKSAMNQLEKLRGNDSLDAKEVNTFISMDSIVKKENIDKKLRLFLAITKGYFKFGQLNLDLINIAQVNRYEGFRLQFGGHTNFEFSPKCGLNGYLAFGFGDLNIKGSIGTHYKLNYNNNSTISLQYQNDVLPIGRSQNDLTLFKDKQDYLIQLMYFGNYFHSQNVKLGFQSDINKHLEQKSYIQFSSISVKMPYEYDHQKIENTSLWTTGIQLRYYPKSEYITTPEGKFAVKERPTQFLFHYAYHKSVNKSIGDFQTASIDMTSSIKTIFGRSNFNIGFGSTITESPILSLFEARGSSISNNNLYQTFGVSSLKYFATMEPNTFYSNQFANVFIQQNLPSIRLSAEKRLYFGLTYKATLGQLFQPDRHSVSLQSPSKIYQEIGFEWNRVFKIVGIGIYSRIGAYHVGDMENNIAGRLIIKL